MTLKERVEAELKKQKRSLSWLAGQTEKSVDGLRLSLVRESIKYGDLVRVCAVLGIRAGLLFGEEGSDEVKNSESGVLNQVQDDDVDKRDANSELIKVLKSQLKDKERIIELLSR